MGRFLHCRKVVFTPRYALTGAGGGDSKKLRYETGRQNFMAPLATANVAHHLTSSQPLSPEQLRKIDAYWRAANYLSIGQIYLYANPLLLEPLKIEHILAVAA
jgi:XFP N-terminal domain